MPPKKQQLPFNFSGCTKNNVDFPTPITNIKPEIQKRMSSVAIKNYTFTSGSYSKVYIY